LVLGQNLGQLTGLSFLLKRLGWKRGTNNWHDEWQQTIALAGKYKDFPLFASWNSGLNPLALHLPPIMLTWHYNPELIGYYAIGMRLLNIPLNMLSMSVGQVFFQQISKYVKNQVPIFPFLRSTGFKLALLGFPGLFLIFLVGPVMFQFIFGENWTRAGEIASILAPYFYIRFIASPLSPIFALIGKQYLSLIWQVIYTLLTFAIMYWGPGSFDFNGVIMLYSIISGLMFFIFLGMEVLVSYYFDRSIKAGANTNRFN
jgi:O-antigen/teichoic acid export membrane protein